MDNTTREHILKLAMTAPNVDNAQPFYFQWQGERLLIFRDEARDRRRGNVGNYVSMVGLGCLVECIAIAASGDKFATEVDFRYSAKNPDSAWLAVSFYPNSAEPDELLPGLKARFSDRREYQGGNLSDPVFTQITADIDHFQACSLYFHKSIDPELLTYMKQCVGFLWKDKHILPEMLSWVRWSEKEVRHTRDGMPWQSLGINYLTSRLMKFVAKSKRFRQLARRSVGPLRAQRKSLEAQVTSSAAVGCLAVRDNHPESMLQLGRLFLRVWVRLNMAGYGVQVMANPAIHAFQYATGILPEDYPRQSIEIFAQGPRILAESFELPTSEIPAWMFRTGKSTPPPAEMRTLRLPLHRVVRPAAEMAKAMAPDLVS